MSAKTIQCLFVFLISLLVLGCKQKMPSTYEVHYSEDMKDSVIFVNYNLTADRSCNFYLKYKLFFKVYNKNGFESVYQYYLKHSEIKRSQQNYKKYKRLGFFFNHNNDTIDYYDAKHITERPEEKKYLKPTTPYHQPTRTYYHIRNK